MKSEMSVDEFRALLKASGNKVSKKGRPVIDVPTIYGKDPTKGNQKVRGATKVFDDKGDKLADSKWEMRVKTALNNSQIAYDFQRKFVLLDTIRGKGDKTIAKTTWTPDFTFERHKLVADAKGFMTDVGWLKIKMFYHFYPDWDVRVVKTVKDLMDLIDEVKIMDEFCES